ncbi:MAG TPA: hypothetical protein VFT58_01690 [Nitrososphaera sp.]|nr:hypothetical protein [Nitrososphaera sp.]
MQNKETFPVSLDKDSQLERKRRTRAWERARNSRTGLATYLMLSGIALRLSIQRERDPRVRQMRKQYLMNRWRQLSGDILQTPFPGARIP